MRASPPTPHVKCLTWEQTGERTGRELGPLSSLSHPRHMRREPPPPQHPQSGPHHAMNFASALPNPVFSPKYPLNVDGGSKGNNSMGPTRPTALCFEQTEGKCSFTKKIMRSNMCEGIPAYKGLLQAGHPLIVTPPKKKSVRRVFHQDFVCWKKIKRP